MLRENKLYCTASNKIAHVRPPGAAMRYARIRGRGPVQNSHRRPENSPRTARSIETGEICGRGFFGRFWRRFRGRPHPVPPASSRGRTREGPETGTAPRVPSRRTGTGAGDQTGTGTPPACIRSMASGPHPEPEDQTPAAPHRRTGGNVAKIRQNRYFSDYAPGRLKNGLPPVRPVRMILLSAAFFSPVFALRSYAECWNNK